MSRPGGSSGWQFGSPVEGGVGAAARGDEVEVGALVGVVGLAAVLGRRADGEDVARARGVGDGGGRGVARGADDEAAGVAGVADRVEDVGDLVAGDVRRELEREVDDLGAVVGGPADAAGDPRGVALAGAVEHLDRHQLDAVGQPGEADRVAGALGDRAGDVGAVAVVVVRVRVVVDEVPAADEALLREVGRAAEACRGWRRRPPCPAPRRSRPCRPDGRPARGAPTRQAR